LAREPDPRGFANDQALAALGLRREQIANSIMGTYRLFDRIDSTLATDGVAPLCQIIELANLSSMMGNIMGAELAKHSDGLYRRNGPHKYPDLLPLGELAVRGGIEIKFSLNRNYPKGHLAKEGYYITCRYILVGENGERIGEVADRPKASKAVIWEVRTGHLGIAHFNLSNTEGDSGKTAVINAAGMEELKTVYVDLAMVPGSQRGARYKAYRYLVGR
jgi:hypothetical protein